MSSAEASNNKLLIITYYWPPAGGPGVQRWLKFTKYLPENGFKPIVITVNENYASYAITDNSLSKEIAPGTTVYKTKTRELYKLYLKLTKKKTIPFSGFVHEGKASLKENLIRFLRTHLFIPDPRRGWNRYAIQKATDIIKQEKIKYLVTTSPPHSSQLIGLTLKKKFPDITWIADFRDPWTHLFYFDQLNHSFISRRLHKKKERNVITKSDKVVVVSPSMKKEFLLDYNEKISADKIAVIPNGYDEKDFTGKKPLPDNDFTITYTGTLAGNYRIDALIETIAKLNQTAGKKIKLRFVGEICREYTDKLRELIGSGSSEIIPPVSHQEAIDYLFRSHLLLLVIPDAPDNEAIITGKLFEYLATKKPILGIGPVEGDAAAILQQTKAGKMFGYKDKELLRKEILHIQSIIHQGSNPYQPENIESFSRIILTKIFVKLFKDN